MGEFSRERDGGGERFRCCLVGVPVLPLLILLVPLFVKVILVLMGILGACLNEGGRREEGTVEGRGLL